MCVLYGLRILEILPAKVTILPLNNKKLLIYHYHTKTVTSEIKSKHGDWIKRRKNGRYYNSTSAKSRIFNQFIYILKIKYFFDTNIIHSDISLGIEIILFLYISNIFHILHLHFCTSYYLFCHFIRSYFVYPLKYDNTTIHFVARQCI